MTTTLDLAALKRYEHHLNEMASEEAIAKFRLLLLIEQCEAASAWAASRDATADQENAERNT